MGDLIIRFQEKQIKLSIYKCKILFINVKFYSFPLFYVLCSILGNYLKFELFIESWILASIYIIEIFLKISQIFKLFPYLIDLYKLFEYQPVPALFILLFQYDLFCKLINQRNSFLRHWNPRCSINYKFRLNLYSVDSFSRRSDFCFQNYILFN